MNDLLNRIHALATQPDVSGFDPFAALQEIARITAPQQPLDLERTAIDVQNACNLSGVVLSWARAMQQITAENPNIGTAARNTHPVNVLFADKVYSLTGYGQQFSQAYQACMDHLGTNKATA